MKAQFDSYCPRCGEEIVEGAEIVLAPVKDFEDLAWVHDVCPDPLAELRLPACSRCGLEHPGEC